MADQANLISDVRLQFQDFFGSLSLGKRITILAALGVILAGMVSLIFIANRPAWAPLYSNLDPGDAARVVEKLQKNSEEEIKGHDVFDVSSSLLFEMELRTSRLSKLLKRCYPIYQ